MTMSEDSGEHLPPGVTAYSIPRVGTLKPLPRRSVPLAAAVGVVLTVVLAVLGGDPVLAPLGFLAGVAVLLVTYPLGAVLRIVVVVLLGGAALGVVGSQAGTSGALAVLVGAAVGLVALLVLVASRARRRRLATATGAPAVDLEPRGGVDVPTFASWRDAVREYEAVDPSPATVIDACRRLDAEHHSYVSIFRGTGRLDVIGEAAGPLVVQQRDHRVAPDHDHWVAHLPSAEAGAVTGERVEIGYRDHQIDRGLVVTMTQVEIAVRSFLHDGSRSTDLAWARQGPRGYTLSPRPIRETD